MDIHKLDVDLNILMDCLPEYLDCKTTILLVNNRLFLTHPDHITVMLQHNLRYTEAILKREIKKRFEVN